jgi:predicted CoA-binding protein
MTRREIQRAVDKAQAYAARRLAEEELRRMQRREAALVRAQQAQEQREAREARRASGLSHLAKAARCLRQAGLAEVAREVDVVRGRAEETP